MGLLVLALEALEEFERILLILERWLATLITHPTVQLAHSTQAFLRQAWSQLTGDRDKKLAHCHTFVYTGKTGWTVPLYSLLNPRASSIWWHMREAYLRL